MPNDSSERFNSLQKTLFTKHLRRNMTVAESILWTLLRGRRSRGLKFRRQVNIGPYIVDFLCKEHRLIIEVDGGIHQSADRRNHDEGRDRYLAERGLRVLRITNQEVLSDISAVMDRIHQAM